MIRFPGFIFSAVLIATVTLTACMQQTAQYKPETEQAALFAPLSPQDMSFTGNYLSGRFAQHHKDWSSAYEFINEVRQSDPKNNTLLQRSFLLALGNGDFDLTQDLAENILETNESPEMALIFLAIDDIKNSQFTSAEKHLDKLSNTGFGHYTKPLLMAWSLAGQGKSDAALDILNKDSLFKTAYTFHAGLISDYAGKNDTAKEYYQTALMQGLTVKESIIIANFFERIGDTNISDTIYTNISVQEPSNPFVATAVRRLKADTPPTSVLTTPSDGAALAMFSLTTLLYEKHAYESVSIYGQLVKHLNPKTYYIDVILGDIFTLNDYTNQAVVQYQKVPESSDLFWMSQLRIAEILEMNNDIEGAIALISELSEKTQYKTDILVYLGDIYRRNEQYNKAVEAYNTALSNVKEVKPEHWSVMYARGMSFEQINDWGRAEKDLLKALEFQPDNPLVLNYLGYSWADQGVHLDKALNMIKRAVSLRPDDGYILDSYGWTLYRMGQFSNSIKWLEEAVGKVPQDLVINDHLGDAYWQVGRLQEAKFQWKRALGFAKTSKVKLSLQNKIKYGLKSGSVVHKEARLYK